MLFAHSRFKFQLRPPKIRLVYYPLCLSILFAILLIAQLRAIELAPEPKSSRSAPPVRPQRVDDRNRGGGGEILVANQTGGRDEHGHASTGPGSPEAPVQVDSIDRDDRPNTYDDSAEPAKNQTQGSRTEPTLDLTESPSNLAAINEPHMAATEQQQPNETREHEELSYRPSLAELTAAGTAAGLMAHDMLAQANMLDQHPYAGQASQRVGADGEDTDQTWPQQMFAVPEVHQHNPGLSLGNAPLQTRQMAEAVAAAPPEPPSEDQMPDSIESLMGAEGATDSNDEDGPQLGGNPNREAALDEGDEPSNELSGGLVPQQAVHQQRSVAAASGNDDDDDEDGNDDDEGERDSNASREGALAARMRAAAALQQAGSQLYGRNRAVPVLMSSPRYDAPSEEAELLAAAKFGGEHEQSLVAPMRDSLVDLNAAAGHYYGKKKKKKVKKVKKKIIIKKKKKKKKKKVYKKVKIIKIKKKKKKVKKKKKHHGHHHNHHDHGKYYMYAKVPKKKSWEFGFKKGNKKHWIERHEKGHKNKFKTKVKWYDKKSKGKGVHIWDYNHHDKKKKKHY